MKRSKNVASARRQRRLFTLAWAALLVIVTFVLIYWEMTAVLYILATVGVSALLVVVALANLGGRSSDDSGRVNDSAAIGSGITSANINRQS